MGETRRLEAERDKREDPPPGLPPPESSAAWAMREDMVDDDMSVTDDRLISCALQTLAEVMKFCSVVFSTNSLKRSSCTSDKRSTVLVNEDRSAGCRLDMTSSMEADSTCNKTTEGKKKQNVID